MAIETKAPVSKFKGIRRRYSTGGDSTFKQMVVGSHSWSGQFLPTRGAPHNPRAHDKKFVGPRTHDKRFVDH